VLDLCGCVIRPRVLGILRNSYVLFHLWNEVDVHVLLMSSDSVRLRDCAVVVAVKGYREMPV